MLLTMLWLLCSSYLFLSLSEYTDELNLSGQIIVILVCLAIGPMFAAVSLATTILDKILPEGWDSK
jgi:hypothetical protein